jgi:hypothetical protein
MFQKKICPPPLRRQLPRSTHILPRCMWVNKRAWWNLSREQGKKGNISKGVHCFPPLPPSGRPLLILRLMWPYRPRQEQQLIVTNSNTAYIKYDACHALVTACTIVYCILWNKSKTRVTSRICTVYCENCLNIFLGNFKFEFFGFPVELKYLDAVIS